MFWFALIANFAVCFFLGRSLAAADIALTDAVFLWVIGATFTNYTLGYCWARSMPRAESAKHGV
jgi:hypothetical protein